MNILDIIRWHEDEIENNHNAIESIEIGIKECIKESQGRIDGLKEEIKIFENVIDMHKKRLTNNE
jgi:archaellum component FlaC